MAMMIEARLQMFLVVGIFFCYVAASSCLDRATAVTSANIDDAPEVDAEGRSASRRRIAAPATAKFTTVASDDDDDDENSKRFDDGDGEDDVRSGSAEPETVISGRPQRKRYSDKGSVVRRLFAGAISSKRPSTAAVSFRRRPLSDGAASKEDADVPARYRVHAAVKLTTAHRDEGRLMSFSRGGGDDRDASPVGGTKKAFWQPVGGPLPIETRLVSFGTRLGNDDRLQNIAAGIKAMRYGRRRRG